MRIQKKKRNQNLSGDRHTILEGRDVSPDSSLLRMKTMNPCLLPKTTMIEQVWGEGEKLRSDRSCAKLNDSADASFYIPPSASTLANYMSKVLIRC